MAERGLPKAETGVQFSLPAQHPTTTNDLHKRIDNQIGEIREDYKCIGALMKYLKVANTESDMERWADIIIDYTDLLKADVERLLALKRQTRTDKVLKQLFLE